MTEISIESGGCVKFDLKAWNPYLHRALCGTDNRRTLDNFARVASHVNRRRIPPLLVASTLLVPGYVDEDEVTEIARFVADLDPDIPYALLGFHPDFAMHSLPRTSRSHADRCVNAARHAGLENVRIGNIQILGRD